MDDITKLKRCIVCDKDFSTDQPDLYSPLKFFDDACICLECLRKEREGWPRPTAKVARVHKLSDIAS
jgi:hypothetical protein